jgi:hypothetical protein
VLPTEYCPICLADNQVLEEMTKLTYRLRSSEQFSPYLHNKISFYSNDFPDPPDSDVFTFIPRNYAIYQSKREYDEIMDPWGTPYFFDGVNCLFHCAGPDKVFGFQCAENKSDDILVSFKPEFYITKVSISKDSKVISITFNKPLEETTRYPESFKLTVGNHSSKVSKDSLIEKTVIENAHDRGIFTIYLLQPLSKGAVEARLPYISVKNNENLALRHIFFKDLRFTYINSSEGDRFRKNNIGKLPVENLMFYGLIKEVDGVLTSQQVVEQRSKRWFSLNK